MKSDMEVDELTESMRGVRIPSLGGTSNGADSHKDRHHRPLDDVRDAGPAADPLVFPRPIFERGRRDDVLYYNEATQGFDVAKDALFRDYSRERGGGDEGLHNVERAYWRVPYKEPISTIMGHVEICMVLTRCPRVADSDGEDNDDDCDASDDEDIVFQITNEHVAVKVNYCDRMERLKHSHAEDPLKEVAAMQLVGNDHPNVLGCTEVLFDGQCLNVVLPYCGNGDLFQILADHKRINPLDPGLPEAKARYWFRQILEGMRHLQSLGICHRDLSPENVMLDDRGCLIIDMGMCLRIPYSSPDGMGAVTDASQGTIRRLIRPQGACGKLPYMAPEIYASTDAFDGFAVDVWTAGTILFCMLTGNSSYKRAHPTDPQFYWMTMDLSALMEQWGVRLSPDALHLVQNMLLVDPRDRMTLDEVLNHPWMMPVGDDGTHDMEEDRRYHNNTNS